MGDGQAFGGEIISISKSKVKWTWFDNNKTTTRSLQKVLAEGTKLITDKELLYLQEDSSLTYTEVSMRIAENRPTTNLHRPLPHVTRDQPLSLEGFWDILNTNKWADTLQWLEEKFDPRTLLQDTQHHSSLGNGKSSILRRSQSSNELTRTVPTSRQRRKFTTKSKV